MCAPEGCAILDPDKETSPCSKQKARSVVRLQALAPPCTFLQWLMVSLRGGVLQGLESVPRIRSVNALLSKPARCSDKTCAFPCCWKQQAYTCSGGKGASARGPLTSFLPFLTLVDLFPQENPFSLPRKPETRTPVSRGLGTEPTSPEVQRVPCASGYGGPAPTGDTHSGR